MTTPVSPHVMLGVPLATVEELLRQAKRLGLIWELRPATVVNTTATTLGAYEPRVVMDGDVTNAMIPVVSLVGPLAMNMRVMVMDVPFGGNYIIGIISADAIRRYEIGAFASHATTISSVEAVLETFTNFVALPGAAYRIEMDGALLAATTTLTRFRIRKTNTAGQSLSASDAFPGVGIAQAPFRHVGYFRNTGTASVTSNLVLTAVTFASTATWYADTETPRYVSIQYAGAAVEYPAAVVIT